MMNEILFSVLKFEFRNVNIDCKLQPSMDLSAWKDEESLSFISDDILMQAIKTAKSDLSQRRKKEELLWNKSEYNI